MQNPLRLRNAALKLSAVATFGDREQIIAAASEMLQAVGEMDPLLQAQLLGGESRPMRPNSDKEPMSPLRYATGRVLRQLGVEANHHNMKQLYERTKPHADLIKAHRRYNAELATGFALEGKPPLVDDAPVTFMDTRALIARYSEGGPAEARAYAVQATAKRLKAECQNKTANTKRKA